MSRIQVERRVEDYWLVHRLAAKSHVLTKFTFRLPPRHPSEKEYVAHLKSRLITTVLYPLFFHPLSHSLSGIECIPCLVLIVRFLLYPRCFGIPRQVVLTWRSPVKRWTFTADWRRHSSAGISAAALQAAIHGSAEFRPLLYCPLRSRGFAPAFGAYR